MSPAPTRLTQARILVVDTETTGVDPRADRIVELGAAYFQAGTRQRLHRMLVNPGVKIPLEASSVHGIRDEDVLAEPTFAVVGARLALHLSGAAGDGTPPVLCGYNAVSYDAAILNAEFTRHGIDAQIEPDRVVDPFIFMKWHHRELRGRKLTEACEFYGLSLIHAHTAAADAQAAGELLFAMLAAGRIPDDLETCLADQAHHRDLVDAEFAEWRTWLYRDRASGELRMGAGKHIGRRPDEVDPDYFRFVLGKMEDLPSAVRAEFARHC